MITLVCGRREWASSDEPCHQKLSFDLWLSMKAQESGAGSVPDEVFSSCLRSDVPEMVQLSVDKVRVLAASGVG